MQVALSWTAVTGATLYNIYRSTVTGGPYFLLGQSTQNSFTDVLVNPGITYYYEVASVTADGESAKTAQVTASPAAVPATPVGLAAVVT